MAGATEIISLLFPPFSGCRAQGRDLAIMEAKLVRRFCVVGICMCLGTSVGPEPSYRAYGCVHACVRAYTWGGRSCWRT